jgi:hypothetical protein
MTLDQKRWVIGGLGLLFLLSLVAVQWLEVSRRAHEAEGGRGAAVVPASSRQCVDCHTQVSRGVVDHWTGSTHAVKGVGCVDCHKAEAGDADVFTHYGAQIATIVTPRDCAACHPTEAAEFARSHHSKGGNILASLDNFLAETVEGSRVAFSPHAPTPGRAVQVVNGMAPANSGCQQCHGSLVALQASDGGMVTMRDLKPDENGRPSNLDALARVVKNESGKPLMHSSTWPNTGIGRINLDGSLGSCSACHSRHDFSARRARQPENCGKCHLGPDHPQKEIYEESKHGAAFRDLIGDMNLDAQPNWVLGRDYSAAPTCATCHMSANTRNGMKITHDPGERISWTNRPPLSLVMDTDANHAVVTETDPEKRRAAIADTAEAKRNRMKQVCSHCHTPDYVNQFYRQYDDLVVLYNEKFARPGQAIMTALAENNLISKTQYDDHIEWTWYYLWHHEGRRARMGASMMAPDYTQWHGMFEVAERFYMALVPEARQLTAAAARAGRADAARRVDAVIDEILNRPEHQWFVKGAEEQADAIAREMQRRYGQQPPR